jgi:hypothetical protein
MVAEQRFEERVLSLSDKAADAENFALGQPQVDAVQHIAHQAARFEKAEPGRRLLGRKDAAKTGAGHKLDRAIMRDVVDIRQSDKLAVAHHCDALTERRDLLPAVRDEQDYGSAFSFRLDDPHQPFNFGRT